MRDYSIPHHSLKLKRVILHYIYAKMSQCCGKILPQDSHANHQSSGANPQQETKTKQQIIESCEQMVGISVARALIAYAPEFEQDIKSAQYPSAGSFNKLQNSATFSISFTETPAILHLGLKSVPIDYNLDIPIPNEKYFAGVKEIARDLFNAAKSFLEEFFTLNNALSAKFASTNKNTALTMRNEFSAYFEKDKGGWMGLVGAYTGL
ncbi:MAG: hypothetical protein M0R33_17235 [Methylomonas sp.]|nr:hypothetical protein [Methylomonas sp.]